MPLELWCDNIYFFLFISGKPYINRELTKKHNYWYIIRVQIGMEIECIERFRIFESTFSEMCSALIPLKKLMKYSNFFNVIYSNYELCILLLYFIISLRYTYRNL